MRLLTVARPKKEDFLLGSPYSPKAGSDESCANNAALEQEKQHAATAPDSFNLLKNAHYLYRMALEFFWNSDFDSWRIMLPSVSLIKFRPEKLKHTKTYCILSLVCFNFSSRNLVREADDSIVLQEFRSAAADLRISSALCENEMQWSNACFLVVIVKEKKR